MNKTTRAAPNNAAGRGLHMSGLELVRVSFMARQS